MTAAGYADAIRGLALSLPETYEDEPWGHPVFKVGANRMFAGMSVEGDAVLADGEADGARSASSHSCCRTCGGRATSGATAG